jgi:predicted permease
VRLINRLANIWHNLTHRDQVERDLDEEVCSTLALLVDEKVRAGMRTEDARRAAALELGGVEIVKDRVRDVRAGALVDAFVRDARYGIRVLRRNPLFMLTAVLSLGSGIGATTTIFTVANGLLFRLPDGVSQPDRLVDISRTQDGRPFGINPISYPNYDDIRRRTTTLDGVYGYQLDLKSMTMSSPSGSESLFGNVVSTNYFTVLGVSPAAGRLFSPHDREELDASPIVVLSYRFWKRRFNEDPSIIGQALQLNGHSFTVVGVANRGFRGTSVLASFLATDVWLPIGASPFTDPSFVRRDAASTMLVAGRLKAGVSVQQAAGEVDAIGRALEREYPDENGDTQLRVSAASPIPAGLRLAAEAFLGLLMGVVSLVLVIACANVAGVLLGRAVGRRREIAVRLAMGAGRAVLVRQLLTETLLLCVLGGGVGVILARAMTSLLVSVLPPIPIPVDVSLPLDGRVLAFTAGLSLLAAVLSGLTPALHASKADVVSALKDESQGPSARFHLRHVFVVTQVAFSILLVVVSGMLVRALERVSAVNQGFDAHGVEVASLDLLAAGYTATTGPRFARELADRVQELPGVQAVTLAAGLPTRPILLGGVTAPGLQPPREQTLFPTVWHIVEPGYFATLRIPILAGRDFNAADRAGAPSVAIVDEATARRCWPRGDAIGNYLVWQPTHHPGAATASPEPSKRLLVIGIARDLKNESRGDEPPPFVVYLPLQQQYNPHVMIFARTTHGQRLTNEIRAVIASMNPNMPIPAPQTLEDQGGPVVTQLRVAASVSGAVGIIGLLLASVGVYGVAAYAVTRRTREIGIRLALGAKPADVVRMVVSQGMSLVAVGSLIGLIAAAAASGLLARLLFGLPRVDLITFAGAAAVFAVIGLAACYVPARRAIQIDAMEALRYE